MGTVAYMSPEQARGEPLDARTDLFSFGTVLFEMATGTAALRRAERRGHLRRDPEPGAGPPSRINPEVRPELDRIVLKALEKDREVRYQTARDLLADLKRLRRDTTSGRRHATEATPVAAFVPAAAGKQPRGPGGGASSWAAPWRRPSAWARSVSVSPRPSPSRRSRTTCQITSDRVEKYGPWYEAGPLTDGSRVYFNDLGNSGRTRIAARGRVRRRSGPASPPVCPPGPARRRLAATAPTCSSWSSTRPGSTRGSCGLVPAVGGTPRRLGDLRANYAAWSPDGKRIALTAGKDLFFANADGSGLRKAWTAGGFLHSPAWSPDGHRLRLSVKEESLIRRSSLWEVTVDGGEPRPLLPRFDRPACCGRWTPDGRSSSSRRASAGGTSGPCRSGAASPLSSARSPPSSRRARCSSSPPSPPATAGGSLPWAGSPRESSCATTPPRDTSSPTSGGMSAHELDFSRDGQWVVYTTYPEASLWRSRVDGRRPPPAHVSAGRGRASALLSGRHPGRVHGCRARPAAASPSRSRCRGLVPGPHAAGRPEPDRRQLVARWPEGRHR